MWLGKATVNLWSAYKRPRSAGKIAAVAFAFGLWLATAALAASPQLHHWLHGDAQDPHHDCLFTQLNQHSLLATFASVIAPEPPQVVSPGARWFAFDVLPSFDYSISRGRAPPSPALFHAVVG